MCDRQKCCHTCILENLEYAPISVWKRTRVNLFPHITLEFQHYKWCLRIIKTTFFYSAPLFGRKFWLLLQGITNVGVYLLSVRRHTPWCRNLGDHYNKDHKSHVIMRIVYLKSCLKSYECSVLKMKNTWRARKPSLLYDFKAAQVDRAFNIA